MATPTLENLRHTLSNIRRRRNRLYALHHISLAVIAVTVWALLLSGIEVLLEPGRALAVLMFVLLLAGVAGAIWFTAGRLRRLQSDDQTLAHFVEDRIPDLEQRLLTSLEFTSDEQSATRSGVSQQFVRQLWADAEAHVQEQQVEQEIHRQYHHHKEMMEHLELLQHLVITEEAEVVEQELQVQEQQVHQLVDLVE